MAEEHCNISVYDYKRNKLCDLYDSQIHLDGQAYKIEHEKPISGIDTLQFSIPYKCKEDGGKVNFRWKYLKSEYIIRLSKNNKNYWFVAQKPTKSRNGKEIVGTVLCESTASLLRTKNIYKEFDDKNGIGTIDYLIGQAIAGTEWTIGHIDPMYEKDGETEKVRSIKSSEKDGALALITKICNIFKARPIFDTDKNTIDVKLMTNREQVVGVAVGQNLDALSSTFDGKDIATRLYVEGEYGDLGYIGIDDVNPTGLNYLMNFDYYKEIGVFTEEHQHALDTYIDDISSVVGQIKENQTEMDEVAGRVNTNIGQCVLAAYYTNTGFIVPEYTYGDPTDDQKRLDIGDTVYILNTDGSYRTDKIVTTPQDLIKSGDYCMVKFALPSSGTMGAMETQVDAKELEIKNLEHKIEITTKESSKAEYQAEIDQLNEEILRLKYGSNGIDPAMKHELSQKYIPADYDGNVDLENRIVISDKKMQEVYPDFPDGDYATLYSAEYTAGSTEEGYGFDYPTNCVISATAIKPDGTVLSERLVNDYLYEIIEESKASGQSLMELDDLCLIERVYVVPEGMSVDRAIVTEGEWSIALHDLAALWDEVRAKYGFFGQKDIYDPDNVFPDIPDGGTSISSILDDLFNVSGDIAELDRYEKRYEDLRDEQDEIEATFIIAMGNMLRDGAWTNNNYGVGQEQAMYDDAVDIHKQMAKPAASYTLDYVRMMREFDIPIEEIQLNAIVRVDDDAVDLHDNLFITKIKEGIDDKQLGEIEISNKDITLGENTLSQLLSRMSQLADLIEQKNAMYERAKAISKSGTFYADRLNGQIDVLKAQLVSTVSNWYTDEKGNLVFLNADGGSAMMLTGAGFMIANSKDEDGNWLYRTFGTGA